MPTAEMMPPPTAASAPPAAVAGRSAEAVRRTVEFVLAGGALLVAALPMAVTAALVMIDLGRPILFRQVRCGKGKVPFEIRKFRTMTDARAADGGLLPDDMRTTPLSRLLRRTRLDEAPQLVSVLRGDMALVGPRPLQPSTVEGFGAAGVLRSTVRPGLTGWAQVSGNTRLCDDEKLALDLWYTAHRSAWLDLWIGLETVCTLLIGERRHRGRIAAARRFVRQASTDRRKRT